MTERSMGKKSTAANHSWLLKLPTLSKGKVRATDKRQTISRQKS